MRPHSEELTRAAGELAMASLELAFIALLTLALTAGAQEAKPEAKPVLEAEPTGAVLTVKKGGTLSGILLDEGDPLVLETDDGRQTLTRSEVAKIEKKDTPLANYYRWLVPIEKTEDRKDQLSLRLDLSAWAKKKGLPKTARRQAQLVVWLAGDDAKYESSRTTAHLLLDHVQVDGVWKPKQDAGYVKNGDEWVTPEQLDAMRWLEREEADAKRRAEAAKKDPPKADAPADATDATVAEGDELDSDWQPWAHSEHDYEFDKDPKWTTTPAYRPPWRRPWHRPPWTHPGRRPRK